MAATVSSVWSKPGAWALDSEENEAELLHQQTEQNTYAAAKATSNGGDASDFPSLAAAASTKTKKKKPQAMSLAAFANPAAKPAAYKAAQTLTPVDLTMLPTGPRERTAEELDRSRIGGGFRSYGLNRDESSSSKWGGGSSRVSDEPPRRQDRELGPSRADEVDDWGATKKSISSTNGFDRRERGERGGFFGSESRADESDNWGSKKSFVPSEGRRFERERRVVGFESSGGADSGNWLKKKEEEGRKIGGAFDSLRERRGGLDSNGGDSENWGKKRGEEGIGSGGVRPKLNLQPRTLPVGDVNQQNGGGGTPPKPKGSNPFGDARPREEVLKDKGQDWKEIDEKHGSKKISEGDGGAFGKRSLSFGSANGRATTPDEGSWRKADSADVRPSSADKVEGDLDHVEGEVAAEAEETQG